MKYAGCWIAFALLIPGYILNGIALSQLWYWFIVPTFNAPPLGLAVAIGVSMTLSLFVNSSSNDTSKSKDQNEFAAKVISYTIVRPLVVIAIGFIITQFM